LDSEEFGQCMQAVERLRERMTQGPVPFLHVG
jgi:hypothetical protein